MRDDVQRERRVDSRQVAVRLFHVRRVELARRLFFNGFDPSPVLHQRGSLLRDSSSARVSHNHDPSDCVLHAGERVDPPRSDQLHAHIPRLVHDREAPAAKNPESGRMRVRRQQVLRYNQQQHKFLDTGSGHGDHVLSDL